MANDPLEPGAIEAIGRVLDVPLDRQTVEALARFGRLFLQWNERINLASLRDPGELPARHFVDAFAASRMIGMEEHVADVGTGGGLPAIPLAIVLPGCRFELFEPIHKKVAFLRTAIREMGLSGRVAVHPFALTTPLDSSFLHRFDVATSRATLAPPVWLRLGTELVREGGKVIVFATGHSVVGLPAPSGSMDYGENRKLLVFESKPRSAAG